MQTNYLYNKKDFLLEHINNKPVYIFEDHATAVIPWLMIKERIRSVPHLITLDHHTDTMQAFRFYYGTQMQQARNCEQKGCEIESEISLLVAKLKELAEVYSYDQMEPLLKDLRNDEHIDLSIKLGILSYSITLPSSNMITSPTESNLLKEYRQKQTEYDRSTKEAFNSGHLDKLKTLIAPSYPHEDDLSYIKTYSMPTDKMFIVEPNIKCDGLSSAEEDSCVHKYNSNVIDDCFLCNQIGLASNMTITTTGKVVTEEPYILDIDLDYFHNTKSINPRNYECFYALIRHAQAITIAKESACVLMGKEEAENECSFNSDFLLNELKKHIDTATSRNK